MGCDLCGASVGRVGRELLSVISLAATGLDCDFWDLGGWAVICVAASVGRVGMELLSGLVRALGVGMEVLSGLDCVFLGFWEMGARWASVQRMKSATGGGSCCLDYGIWGGCDGQDGRRRLVCCLVGLCLAAGWLGGMVVGSQC